MSSPAAETPGRPAPAWLAWAGLAAVLAGVFALYLPALGYPFLDLDDFYGVVENPGIRELSWDGVRFLFFEDERDVRWFPLAYLSFAVDHAFAGLDPAAFHRTNLVLHLANVALLFALILRLSGSGLVAFVTSALFGLHPLQVESVAWVSSRKNVLFLLFFLLSALTYLPHARRAAEGGRAPGALAASVVLFTLALCAKPAAAPLPALLVLIDHHLARGLPRSPFAFLARSLPSKLLYVPPLLWTWAMTQRLAAKSPFHHALEFTPLEWAVIVGHNLFVYVAQAVAPLRLGVFHPLPSDGLPWHFPVYAAASAALLALGIASYGRRRNAVLGLGWYFAAILPMAALPVLVGDIPLLAADRYFYPAGIGLFFLVGVAIDGAWRRAGTRPAARAALVLAGMAVAIALFASSARQRHQFRGDLSLYEQAVRAHPSDAFGYRLAIAYANAGQMGPALDALEAAEGARHQVFFTHLFGYQLRIADLHRRAGSPGRAAAFLRAAIASTPNFIEPVRTDTPLAWRYLADLYTRAGDRGAAAEARTRARSARVDPSSFFESHWLTTAPADARDFLERRLAEAPVDAVAWHYLGRWHALHGEPERARELYSRAEALGFSLPPSAPGA